MSGNNKFKKNNLSDEDKKNWWNSRTQEQKDAFIAKKNCVVETAKQVYTVKSTNKVNNSKFKPWNEKSDDEKRAYMESIGKTWLSKDQYIAKMNAEKQNNTVDFGLDDDELHPSTDVDE